MTQGFGNEPRDSLEGNCRGWLKSGSLQLIPCLSNQEVLPALDIVWVSGSCGRFCFSSDVGERCCVSILLHFPSHARHVHNWESVKL